MGKKSSPAVGDDGDVAERLAQLGCDFAVGDDEGFL